MNNKQKLGYTLLGAGIMLVGLTVGAIISPPLIAQRNGVFGKIECTGLTVIDEQGKVAVMLTTATEGGKEGSGVYVLDKHENIAVGLGSFKGSFGEANKMRANGVVVYDKEGNAAIVIGREEEVSANVVIIANQNGKPAVVLGASEEWGNLVSVHDKHGNIEWEAP